MIRPGFLSPGYFRVATIAILVSTLACSLTANAADNAKDKAASAPVTAPQPIQIGVPVSRTGPLAGFASQRIRGMQQFVRDINGRGTLLGRPVELVTVDDYSTPAGARAAFATLAESGVQLFISPYSSTLTLALRDAVYAHDVAMVAVASAPEIWDRPQPRIFGLYTPADANMLPLLRLAKERNLRRLGLLYNRDDEFPVAVAAGVRAHAAQHSLEIVFDQGYSHTDADYDALVANLAASNPDVVAVGSYLEDALALSKAAQSSALQPTFMAFSGGPALRKFGVQLGYAGADGLMSTVQWMRSARFPGSFDFGFRYRDRHGIYPSYDAAGGYAALQVLEAAVRLAGSTDPALVRKQLQSMKFRSIIGHYRVDDHGRQTAKSTYLVQWQDTHISLVYPAQVARFPVREGMSGWR